MHHETSRLLLYGDLGEESILRKLADIFARWEQGGQPKEQLTRQIYDQVKRLLDLATEYCFDGNLWQDYLAYVIIYNENSFSLTCEQQGAGEGSVNALALADLETFLRLFRYDFSAIEADLGVDCFSRLCDYQALPKQGPRYNRQAGEKIHELSQKLAACSDAEQAFRLVTEFYRRWGVGDLGLNRAFRLMPEGSDARLLPIKNVEMITLDDLVGYESQKQQLRDNTEAFLQGRAANNVLLYGDSGTGKSTSVKALLNEYYDQGLRMIQIDKYQFRRLAQLISAVKDRNYRFIIVIDDLSFEENEVEYKYLKSVIEGGLERKPANILIYATSNRRHLIRETWNDRGDMQHDGDLHRSDTMEEKLSLAGRFGVQINFSQPDRAHYHAIVEALARRQGVDLDRERLLYLADRWELRHGGVSGRTAQQFVNYMEGREDKQ